MSNDNAILFESVEDLLDAEMDDLLDLPPVGAPPSGHYNFTITVGKEEIGDDKKEVMVASFIVDAINELKNEEEADEVKVGQEFKMFYHMTKKDGSPNKFGIGTFKQLLAPFSERFGVTKIREVVEQVNQIAITASIKRTVNRKNEDQFNVNIKDIVLL